MKYIYLLVVFCLSFNFTFSQTDSPITDTFELRLLKAKDLPSYLSRLETNDNFQLERLSAYLFHQKINEYRIQNGKSWLFWNEDMWLAARNHNIYMLHQFILTHGENPDSAYYTGVDPEARYIYVSDNPINLYASGENCRFSMGSIKGGGSSFDLANSIANESFESWKESPGHNKNMLSDSYNMQGTSFIYLGLLYGTTVFGNDRKGVFEINEINLSWDKELEANVKPVFVINNREVFSSTSEEELFARLKSRVDKILQLSKVQYCPKMEFIANKNLEYMEANKQNTSLQSKTGLYYYAKSTKQRWMRAEGKFKLNTLLFYKINEKTIYLSFELKDFFNIEKIFALIDVEVSKSMVPADLIDQYGSAIKFFKKGHFYYCIVDIVYTMKK